MDAPINIVFDIWSVILGFGFLQGALLILTILATKLTGKSKFYLIVLISIISLSLFNYLLINTNLFLKAPHLTHLFTPLFLLLGPIYYWYINSLLSKNFVFRKSDLWHLLPFGLAILYFMPYYLLNTADKIYVLKEQLSSGAIPFNADTYIFLIIQISQSFIYILISIKQILKSKSLNHKRVHKNKTHWLIKFSYCFMVFWAIDFLAVIWYIIQRTIVREAYYITTLSGAIFIYVLVIFAIRNNKIFVEIFLEPDKKKYKNFGTQTEDLKVLSEKLLEYMKTAKPFLQTDFSLTQLSEAIETPQHIISQVLNTELKKSFYELINEYRFKEVKIKLIDPEYQHFTILAIAYESGFSNKNTFNKVFKNETGITPSQYRKSFKALKS